MQRPATTAHGSAYWRESFQVQEMLHEVLTDIHFRTAICYSDTVSPKNVHVFIFWDNCQNLTDFNIFRTLNPEKI